MKMITAALILFGLAGSAAAEDINCPPDPGAVTIDGNVLVSGPCTLDGTTVKGNVHLYSGGSLIARNASIGGNIQAFGNTGGVEITNNTVDGNLQCESNDPAPASGLTTAGF